MGERGHSVAQRHYLDYAATAPLRPEVFQAMLPWFGLPQFVAGSAAGFAAPASADDAPVLADGDGAYVAPAAAWLTAGSGAGGFGNASTLYVEGKAARQALEAARASFAEIIGAQPTEVIFTSGGTEADTAAIIGMATAARASRGKASANHIVCAAFEHQAVIKAVAYLRGQDFQVSMLKPRADGFIHPDDLQAALRPETVLVTIMLVQNEIGTVQQIAELAEITHRNAALLHCDAVQALGKLPLNLATLGADAVSFSAHKIGGPKGVGALYLRDATPFTALMAGGGQEGGRRGGTQNVAAAVGFAAAAQIAASPAYLASETERLVQMRDTLAARLIANDSRISLTVPLTPGDSKHHVCSILSLLVDAQQSEMMVLRLDEAGIAVSGGSACSTGSLKPSHVLTSLGIGRDRAYGSLRISLGWASSEADIQAVLAAFLGRRRIIHCLPSHV